MKKPIILRRATLSAVTFVAANARQKDRDEFDKLLGGTTTLEALAAQAYSLSPDTAYEVWEGEPTDGGQPIFVFGILVSPLTPHIGTAWGYGTRRAPLAYRKVQDFFEQIRSDIISKGVQRVEVRVDIANPSYQWLRYYLDANYDCALYRYGRNNESFIQLSWIA